MSERPKHLEPNEHWSLAEPSESDKQLLAGIIGQAALDFLNKENISFYVETRVHNYFKDITIFYFEVKGRVVELIHKSKDMNKLELAYTFVDDFLTKDDNRYSRDGDLSQFDESTQFIRFLMRFLSSFRKDAPLVIRTFDQKRRKLAELLVKAAKLTNVKM